MDAQGLGRTHPLTPTRRLKQHTHAYNPHLSALGTGAEAGRGSIDVRVARTRPPHQPRGGRKTMTPLVLAAI